MSTVNVFDFIKDLNYNKNYLYNETNKDSYNPFIINKSFSFFVDTIYHAQMMNLNSHLPHNMQHDYLFYAITKRKRYSKWLKKSEEEKEMLESQEFIANKYNLSIKDVKLMWNYLPENIKKLYKKYNNLGNSATIVSKRTKI